MRAENLIFLHSNYLFCHPFDSTAWGNRISPTRYAPSYIGRYCLLACDAVCLPNNTTSLSRTPEAYMRTLNIVKLLDN